MAPALTFLLSTLYASYVVAIPQPQSPAPLKLDVSRRFNAKQGLRLVDIDRARVEAIKARFQGKAPSSLAGGASSFPVTNAGVTYTASVGVGNPPTKYDLLIDTGSSNTWLGADKKYVASSTSSKTKDKFSLRYGSGSVSGNEYIDQITLSSSLVIQKQSIGVSTKADGFEGVDGILGVGPVGLTVGTLSPSTRTPIPTVTDNLFAQGTIPTNSLGIYFQPTTQESTVNGELTFGGYDASKIKGSITYTPITTTSPASAYWGITQSLNYGSSQILKSSGGIVDTGTTLVYIASDAFKKYLSATGGAVDKTTGLVKIPNANVAKLQSLFFKIGSASLELTANAQLWPRSLNTYIGGDANSTYSVVTDIGTVSGQGLDFINGYTFLERYYTIYDTSNKRVGFAETAYTFATSN